MRQIYFTRDDLKSRIEQNRDTIELLGEVIAEHILLFSALEGKEDCVVDQNGKVLRIGNKKETYYEKTKPRDSMLKRYRGVLGGWEGAKKKAWVD